VAILTISREYGSGGRDIGRMVAKNLDYEYVDRKKILDDMRDEGTLWEEKARHFDENYPELWERNEWAYKGFVALNQLHFLEYALKDKVVLMGRGGNFLLKKFPFVLKVRTRAPLEYRIERIMEREQINAENARYLIEKVDNEMSKAVYLIYGRHWDDPGEYDLVFDTSAQAKSDIISEIQKALLEKEKYNTPEAREILRLRVLAKQIKATVLTDPSLVVSTLDVDPKEEGLPQYGLVLRGVVHKREDIESIRKIAQHIAGNIPIELSLQYRMYPRLDRR